MTRVFLRGLTYEMAEPRPINDLAELRENPELLDTFASLGLGGYSPSPSPPLALARACLERTLWKSRLEPEEIDYVLYASSSVDAQGFKRKAFDELLDTTGLAGAYPIGVTFGECANAASALVLSRSLLVSGAARNVVVVAADARVPGESRIVPPDISVASDAAASLVLSTTEGGLFELESTVAHRESLAYEERPQEDSATYLRFVAEALARLRARVEEEVTGDGTPFRWLLPNNFNASVARLYAWQMGFGEEEVYTRNIERFGHALAADVLVNLADCYNSEQIDAGDRVLLLSSAPTQWVAISLRSI